MGRAVHVSICKPGGASRVAWNTGLCLLEGNADSSADVIVSMKAVKYSECQGSGGILLKIAGQVFSHFPPLSQALVLHGALAG